MKPLVLTRFGSPEYFAFEAERTKDMSTVTAASPKGQLPGAEYLEFIIDKLPQPALTVLDLETLLKIGNQLPESVYPTDVRAGMFTRMFTTDCKDVLQLMLERAVSLHEDRRTIEALNILWVILEIIGNIKDAKAMIPAAVISEMLQFQDMYSRGSMPIAVVEYQWMPYALKGQLYSLLHTQFNFPKFTGLTNWLDKHTARPRRYFNALPDEKKVSVIGMAGVFLLVATIGLVISSIRFITSSPIADSNDSAVVTKRPDRKPVPLRHVPDYQPKQLALATSLDDGPRSSDQPTLAEDRQLRRLQMEEYMDHVNLGTKQMVNGIVKVLALNKDVEKAAQQFLADNPKMAESFESQLGLPRENLADLVLGLIWRESQGDWNAKSDSGPIGPGQFTEDTGCRMGLTGDCVLQGKKYKSNFRFDDRNKPEKVIPAILKLLKIEYETFKNSSGQGRWDMAVFAYHSGDGRVGTVVEAAKSEGYQWVSYDDLFFVDPLKHPKTWKAVQSLMTEKNNYGPTYWYGVYRSMGHLWLFWNDQKKFNDLARAQFKQDSDEEGKLCRQVVDVMLSDKSAADKKTEAAALRKKLDSLQGTPQVTEKATRLYWSAYSCRDLLQNFTQQDMVNAASSGQIVRLPAGDWGISIRPPDQGGPGAFVKDYPDLVDVYQRLSPEAWGMFITIAYHFKQITHKDLDLTSLIRDWAYQRRLNESEGQRGTALPLHTLTIGGDIGFRNYSADDIFALKYVLNELMYAGLVSWAPENDHYHVVALPNAKAKEVFMHVYQNAVSGS